MKDGRERLRLENESLNNVVSRKDRLLQELLERARKAEAEAADLKAQVKADSTNQKKLMKQMETTMVESTAVSEKAQSEYITLKDSVKGLRDGWQADVDFLRTEMKKREDEWKKEVRTNSWRRSWWLIQFYQIDEVNLKYRGLVKLTQAAQYVCYLLILMQY